MPHRNSARPAVLLAALLVTAGTASAAAGARPVRILIVDGQNQNNHDWRRTTSELQGTLEAAGIFQVAKGVEWAARRQVTLPVPANFPTAQAVSIGEGQ